MEPGLLSLKPSGLSFFCRHLTPDITRIIDFNASRSLIPDNKPLSGLNPITAVSSAVKYKP
jgi:hypothetical protein